MPEEFRPNQSYLWVANSEEPEQRISQNHVNIFCKQLLQKLGTHQSNLENSHNQSSVCNWR